MSSELSSTDLQRYYQQFLDRHVNGKWLRDYLAEVEHFRRLDDAAFRSPREQEHLWRARGITGVGPGESVSTSKAYAAPEVVDAFAALRRRAWASEPGRRAREIQDVYDQILELVYGTYSTQRPQAKLGRAFAALLPAHTTTCLNWTSFRASTRLVLGPRSVAQLEGAVLVRARLRGVLGEEAELTEHVRRSMFCWWLHENATKLDRGQEPEPGEPAAPDDEAATLTMWAAAKQRKGLAAYSGQIDLWRSIVNATRGGAEAAGVVDAVKRERSRLSKEAIRSLMNDVRWLELIESGNGSLWYPTDGGEQLLETDPPENVIEQVLTQVFGPAWVLRILDERPRKLTEVGAAVREVYPGWTTDYTVGGLCSLLVSLGLVETTPDSHRRLTDYGRAWLERLPADLPVPEAPDTDREPPSTGTDRSPTPSRPWPSLDEIVAAFASDRDLQPFVFKVDQIRALHLAWHCHPSKRFAILSGLSGTGKTALLLHYARVYCGILSLPVAKHREVVAVSPDWRDPTGLLGYLNALHEEPNFQAEPALRLLLRAADNPELPYFLILDEMNLARVERYFAPFLSAMETGSEINLHANSDWVNGVPPTVDWPSNLIIGGTVNMDETTHAFSDKVLDRAFTLEFYDVDLEAYLARRAARGPRQPEVESVLLAMNQALRPVRRHFGYRTAGEVLDFVAAAGAPDEWQPLADQALFSKVLPRLRGEHTPALQDAIEKLVGLCRERELPRCASKLETMRQRLDRLGVTGFWS